jgi:uncharacterized protein (UPF0332 family)
VTRVEIANEQRRAAQLLLTKKDGCPRATCSRAYYAAYALISSLAPTGMRLSYGLNPGHHQLPGIIDQVTGAPKSHLKRAVSRLRLSRDSADYGVGQTLTASEAKERLRDCEYVFRELSRNQNSSHVAHQTASS